MKFYCEEVSAALAETESTENGISAEAAALRLEQNGKNKLAEGKKNSALEAFPFATC